MQKITSAFFLATMLAVPCAVSAPAQAETYYPWCAVYGGRSGGASNCGFSTYEQCRATVSGIGGFCQRNSFYTGPASHHSKRKHRRQSED